ncbi:helix-turn-helix domain-containing protein [Nocardioides sp. WV_118_6]|uniref:PucR family transcriptional regulator n=1 Tax=Nocardioides simplex TaxID=2045 RepID=UPI00214FD4E9|nr:helix-turn-helix domain-containing protein [Pimelobacter simplex]UUW87225.1 helix-turn-helix domain-containing protein [Pimelobacter simplex]UUW96731.1 helix-turn-helix domain-containing protein [Pimelobacter simplex]
MTTLDDLVEDMARLTDAPCTLEDPGFRLIGFSDHRGDDVVDWIRQRSILERRSSDEVRAWFRAQGIEDSPGPLRTPADTALGIVGRLCVPARHLGRVHGYFWLIDPAGRIDEATWPEAVRIAESAARLLDVAERRQAHRDALFRDLVEGGRLAARASAVDLAQAAGLDLDEPVTCVLVERPELLDQVASRPSRPGVVWVRAGAGTGTAAAVARATLVTPTPGLDDLLAAVGLGRRLDALDRVTRAALGPTVPGIDGLAAAHRGARVALRVARTRPPGSVVAWSDLGPLALLGVARDDDLADAVLDPRLRAFLATVPPDVLATVRTWLDEAGSASRTATRLAVHRQTVYHRLGQVEQATGLDLARGADRLRLHLGLELAPFLTGA